MEEFPVRQGYRLVGGIFLCHKAQAYHARSSVGTIKWVGGHGRPILTPATQPGETYRPLSSAEWSSMSIASSPTSLCVSPPPSC